MSFLVAVALLVGMGLALLALLRLGTGARLADVALAWFLGSGVYAAAASMVRFVLGVPLGRGTALALVLAPPALWAGLRAWRRRTPAAPPAGAGAPATPGTPAAPAARWLPRPLWLFAPLALYVAVVLVATVLHGVNTPTLTDDGVRVRAYASILAFQDAWSPEARAIFTMAAPVTTFVPALGWTLGGTLVHFHVNYSVLADLVALLILGVALASARGAPERGWAGAFALLSIPLFVYHCTQTYADVVLAMRLGAAMIFVLEYARTSDRGDVRRALLLLGLVAIVKREGELVALAALGPLLLQLAVEAHRGRAPFPWRAVVGLAVVPALVSPVTKIAAAGLAEGFPLVSYILQQNGLAGTPPPDPTPVSRRDAADLFFTAVLFRSGNSGMVFWVFPAAIAVRARTALRDGLAWPLLGVAALLAEVALGSVVLLPRFTVDQSTVHRALLVVTVPAALWLAAALTGRGGPPEEAGEDEARGAKGRAGRRAGGSHQGIARGADPGGGPGR